MGEQKGLFKLHQKGDSINKRELIDLIKQLKIDKINISDQEKDLIEILITGTKQDMSSKQEKGFNETQKRELIEIITTVVPPMVRNIIQEEVNPRLDRIEQRLDNVEQRLDNVEQRLDNVEQRLDNVEQRLGNVEKDIKAIKSCPTIQKELIQ